MLTIGARRQTIEQNAYNVNSGFREPPAYDKSKISPVAGIVFKATPTTSLYANYIQGLVKGDVAPDVTPGGVSVSNKGTIFSPYVAKQKEIGVKYDGGRIGGNLALFQTDKPITAFERVGAEAVYGPYGEQRNRGLELSVFGQPVRGVRVLGGLTLLDAEQTKTQDGITNGKDAIGVAKRQFNLGAEWGHPGCEQPAVNARMVYTSKQYADAANTQSVPSWTRVDLGARYLMDIGNNRTLTMRARVDNLFDKNYWSSVGGYPGSGYLVLGAPRTFMLTGTIDF